LPINKYQEIKNNFEIRISQIQAKNIKFSAKQKKLEQNWQNYFLKIDKLLAQYKNGPVYLNNTRIAETVASSLQYHDSADYDLLCYCIMSNHVHIVFTLLDDARSLDKIMFSIKRYTAGEANKILNRRGQFWQHESYDHIVRNEKALYNIINYVINNPVDAGLVIKWQDWKWTYLKKLDIL
jgi:REP element-mobilizing transposase RayT